MAKTIGIDLGTTNSVMALVKSGPQVVVNRENERLTRSVVGAYRGKILVGTPAVNRGRLAPDTILSVKRLMGRAYKDLHVQEVIENERCTYEIVSPPDGTADSLRVRMGDKLYSPAQISSLILRKLTDDMAFREKSAPTHAIVTVPAYFSEKQRVATYQAAQMADLQVVRLIHEPAAAAIRYGVEDLAGSSPKTVLVYDMGGGTFDVSIMMIAGGNFPEIRLDGDMWLGGDDFDQRLMDFVLHQCQPELGSADPRQDKGWMFWFREETRKVKEQLSAQDSVEFFLTLPNGREVGTEITRPKFESLIAPLVSQSMEVTDRAVEKAGLSDADIDFVIVAGGASSIPLIQERLEQRFGADRLLRNLHPKEVVAEGAAILATRLGPSVSCPACGRANVESAERCDSCDNALKTFVECLKCGERNRPDGSTCESCGASLGPRASGIANTVAHYYVIALADGMQSLAKPGDVCDKEKTKRFYTSRDNQRVIEARIYKVNEENAAQQTDTAEQTSCAVLPPGLPKGTPVDLTWCLSPDLIYQLRGKLQSGTPVAFFKLQGEQNSAAVEVLERAEASLAHVDNQTRIEHERELADAREKVFQALKEGATAEKESLQEAANKFVEARQYAQALLERAKALEPQLSPIEIAFRRNSWMIGISQEYSQLVSAEMNEQVVKFIRRAQALESTKSVTDAEHYIRDWDDFDRKLTGRDDMWWNLMFRIADVYRRNAARGRYFDNLREQIIATHTSGENSEELINRLVDELVTELKGTAERCPTCGVSIGPSARRCVNGHDLGLWLLAGNAQSAGISSL